MRKLILLVIVLAALFTGISGAAVEKDFRYTAVNFTPVDLGLDPLDPADDVILPAVLGDLLPYDEINGTYTVNYVLKKKTGLVASTNPGQLYGVITITDTGDTTEFAVNDTFGDQFDINPGKICGGVDVIRVNATGYAEILTGTGQVSGTVDNAVNRVLLDIVLETPLGADEQLMIYCKFQTTEKGLLPVYGDFLNEVIVNDGYANATVVLV